MTWSSIRALIITSTITVALATQVQAQQILKTYSGIGGAHFGWASDGLGDLNGDNFPEVIIGSPEDSNFFDEAGRVIVISGRNSTPVFEFFGEHEHDNYGQFVSGVGDVNKDGTPDFLIGSPFGDGSQVDSGYAELRSGVTGSVIYKFNGDLTGDTFGDCCSPAGDVNNDGWIDMVIGGRGSDGNGTSSGIARVFSGFDGSTLYTFYGLMPGALAGSALAAPGDVNGDGYDDIGVGSKGAKPDGLTNAGQVLIYSGFNGSILLQVDGRHVGDGLGSGIGGLGDVNGDGVLDLGIGAWQIFNNSPVNQGYVLVTATNDGHAVYQMHGEKPHDSFGVWVDSAGDANRDGYPDIVLGSNAFDCSQIDCGQLRVVSGKDGAELYRVCGEGIGDGLGHIVSNAGDLNQDGYDDVIAGAYWNDNGGHNAGATYVFSGCPAVLQRVGTDLVGSNGLPPNLAGCGHLAGNDPLTFRLVNARPLATAALIIGLTEINLPFKGGLCVPAPDLLIFVQTNAAGTIDLAGTWPTGMPPQVATYYQFWLNDPGSPTGWAASNAVRAVTP